MLSNLILRMNRFQPQRGRWITRTVLNHMGRECFVIRVRLNSCDHHHHNYGFFQDKCCVVGGLRIFSSWMLIRIWCWFVHTRVAKGIWRKSGDRPEGVDWHERVIDVCEGGWTYVAGATGYAPSKFRSVFEIRAGVLDSHIIINDVCVPHIILSFNCSCRADDRGRMIDDDPFLINCRCCCWFVDRQNCRKCNSVCGWAWALQIELAPEQWQHVGHLQALTRWPRLGT